MDSRADPADDSAAPHGLEAPLLAGPPDGSATAAAASIQAWLSAGKERFDPVRVRFVEAMIRRAQAHRGAARLVLDKRIAALIAELLAAQAEATSVMSPLPVSPRTFASSTPAPSQPSPLWGLLDHIARHAALPDAAPVDGPVSSTRAAPSELKTLSYFRSTWSRLSADQRLTQSRAKIPKNAGPLNSHHLLHRSLSLMRDLSPGYLSHFMAHVDALFWLDQVQAAAGPVAKEAPRSETPKKAGRGKTGNA